MMNNKINQAVFFLVLFFMFVFSPILKADDLEYVIISEGYLSSDNRSRSMVVKEKEVLGQILSQLGADVEAVDVDFNTETVALIVSEKNSYPDRLVIKDIKKNNQDIINVNYSFYSIDYVPEENEEIKRPYKLIKISPGGKKFTRVSFRQIDSTRPVFVNNSVDDIIKYTNILEDNRENLFLNYLPLDKGNSWTYDYESPGGKGSQTFSIVTYTNGWSIFDSFFGMNNLALRLDRGGHIYVSSDKGNRSFYTSDVIISYPKNGYKSRTGEYDDILVVTSNPKSGIKFKDIYAKNVGLIYHEHESKDGLAKYSLSDAYVRGKQIH